MNGISRHTRLLRLAPISVVAAACTMPPGGGVSGVVLRTSGEPLPNVTVTLTSESRILGMTIPFAEPARVVTSTDDNGHFGVVWSHGEADQGPLLEVSAPGYSPASERLGVGYLECEVLLVPVATRGHGSEANCRPENASIGDGQGATNPQNKGMNLSKRGV